MQCNADTILISIPYGSIKRLQDLKPIYSFAVFQFLMVQLKENGKEEQKMIFN